MFMTLKNMDVSIYLYIKTKKYAINPALVEKYTNALTFSLLHTMKHS